VSSGHCYLVFLLAIAVDGSLRTRGIYYLHPAAVDSAEGWGSYCARCCEMGFDTIAIPPPFAPGPAGDLFLAGDLQYANPLFCRAIAGVAENHAPTEAVIGHLASACRAHGLGLLVDIVIDRIDAHDALAHNEPELFRPVAGELPDPRLEPPAADIALARFDTPQASNRLLGFWRERLKALLQVGAAGFRFLNPGRVAVAFWDALSRDLRHAFPNVQLLAFTPGMAWRDIEALATVRFDGVFSSLPWWDRRSGWFAEELNLLRRVAPVIACPEAPFDQRLIARLARGDDVAIAYRQALGIAAATGDILMVPTGFEDATRVPLDAKTAEAKRIDADSILDFRADIGTALRRIAKIRSLVAGGETRALGAPNGAVSALFRTGNARRQKSTRAVLALINSDLARPRPLDFPIDPLPPMAGSAFGHTVNLDHPDDPKGDLMPGEVRILTLERLPPIHSDCPTAGPQIDAALDAPRIVIDAVTPNVDDGRFVAKCLIGAPITITADIFTDGHGVIDADLLWKAADEPEWHRAPLRRADNDQWEGTFTPARVGRHWFTIEAWIDEFGSLCKDIEAKQRAQVDFDLELTEAQHLIAKAAATAKPQRNTELALLLKHVSGSDRGEAASILLSAETRDLMRQAHMRPFLTRHEPTLPLDAERPQAGFSAWYELFPRSAAGEPGRHGTFRDVVAQLPRIKAMGFDVLYLPPIHPIGATNRKGRNNSLVANADDPGSPYAIGASDGGHDAIHAELGTIEDFRALVAAAAERGMEIALDFAIQCSPDHPWLGEHPNWFRWRPDGSLRFAENPPKKYEDIVNLEFYADDATREVWTALRDVVLFWIGHGVKIFRVDNPHTKPLPFWEWMIGDIRARHPDVIFLAEAFTRPKLMYRLAKLGFSQSYTYFTWRNTKRELADYLTELTTTSVKDYFRPHFFVNTPDINPYFLQESGRPGFLIRAVLAATLSGLWGIYSGFEICEAAPLPGREEYLDSEKYEIRQRDYAASGNIVTEITHLNHLRKTHPALQSHLGVSFYNAFNDQILVYGKTSPYERGMILIAVNLDPHHAQEATFELPLWTFGLPDDASATVTDLITDRSTVWTGKMQRVRLDPADLPYAIWRILPLTEARS
jgi:starch synthase (maltosyl-transferring)